MSMESHSRESGQAYAHTLAGQNASQWEPLEKHLQAVAMFAEKFAAQFGAAQWGTILGLCHDLGKYSAEFQNYLLATADPDAGAAESGSRRVDHSTFGARYVKDAIGKHKGQMLAYCIAGHHAGLPDGVTDEASYEERTLQHRLDSAHHPIPEVACPVIPLEPPDLKIAPSRGGLTGFQVAFFTRMVFSCLVDADRLATESFCDPSQANERAQDRPTIAELKTSLDDFLELKQASASLTTVNCMRAEVLRECRKSAQLVPGFFSLNVPTGGGKTYSSLSFALDHALYFDLRRVVFAAPFTTIIEQTTDAFRLALGNVGSRGLIEHHTNIDARHDTRCNQFGTENWDAPLIVTTNVQLFESLFAASTSFCRKLHRLAGSVIVLDEAQTVPVELLRPTLAALNELIRNYGCSVVLCTATQPALERRPDFELGIETVRQIVADPVSLFESLCRVEVHRTGVLTDEQLTKRLVDESSVLCVVNTRAHAARMFRLSLCLIGSHGLLPLEHVDVREPPPRSPCHNKSTVEKWTPVSARQHATC